jgi:hypothetical protein
MQAIAQPQVGRTASVKIQIKVAPPAAVARSTAGRRPVRRFLELLMVALSAPAI